MIATNQTGIDELRGRGKSGYMTFELTMHIWTRVAGITLELQDIDGGNAPNADISIYASDMVVKRTGIPQNVSVNL